MKVITALGNPKTNKMLRKETNFEIIGNDIQYKEGIIEILEEKNDINLILISEILSGQIKFKELIEKIKSINKEIEIIVILKKEKEDLKNYLISKGIFNIFYNNKITNDELIDRIKNIDNIKKENEINAEIKNLKKIILEANNNSKKINIISQIYLKIKNKIINKNNFKRTDNRKISNENKIISIVGTNGIGKSIFASIFAKEIKNKKILLIDFDVFNKSLNSIFNIQTKKNKDDLITRINKNIDLLCWVDFLFDEQYHVEKNKIKIFLEKFKKDYDLIIVDTTSECFFDYTKEILKESDLIIFLAQGNLIELKKSKNLLGIYINKWKIEKEKTKIVFNKNDINSISNEILKILFSDFNIIGKIKLDNQFNLMINNHLKNINKKIKKDFQKIIDKCYLYENTSKNTRRFDKNE